MISNDLTPNKDVFVMKFTLILFASNWNHLNFIGALWWNEEKINLPNIRFQPFSKFIGLRTM